MAWMISFAHTHLYFSTVDQQHAGLGGGGGGFLDLGDLHKCLSCHSSVSDSSVAILLGIELSLESKSSSKSVWAAPCLFIT